MPTVIAFVRVLGAVLDRGLDAVEAACAEALEAGIATRAELRLNIEPVADCARYDSIRMLA